MLLSYVWFQRHICAYKEYMGAIPDKKLIALNNVAASPLWCTVADINVPLLSGDHFGPCSHWV